MNIFSDSRKKGFVSIRGEKLCPVTYFVSAGTMTAKVSGVSGWKEVEPNVWGRVKAGSTQR